MGRAGCGARQNLPVRGPGRNAVRRRARPRSDLLKEYEGSTRPRDLALIRGRAAASGKVGAVGVTSHPAQ